MEPVEIRDIQYILAVWQERSISRAAEKCYISQPALSKIVKRVETGLGTAIFDRGSVPLRVTPEGEVFLDYFKRIKELYGEMEQYRADICRQKKCDVRIGAPSFFCTYVLPPILSAFLMDNPDFQIRLIETNDSDLKKFLRAGAVDLGISVEEGMKAEFDSFLLQNETIILAVPRSLPVNRELSGYSLRFEDIKDGRFREPDVESVPMERFSGEPFLFLKQGNDMHRRGLKFAGTQALSRTSSWNWISFLQPTIWRTPARALPLPVPASHTMPGRRKISCFTRWDIPIWYARSVSFITAESRPRENRKLSWST